MREMEVLERLSYIVEAIAENLPAEAKHKTAGFVRSLDESAGLDPQVREFVLAQVRSAERLLQSEGRYFRGAAVSLSSASRYLWDRALSAGSV